MLDTILKLMSEIKKKQEKLDEYIKNYNWLKLQKFILNNKNDSYLNTIDDIVFKFYLSQQSDDWKITYIHKTKYYNTSNYCLNYTSENDLRGRNNDGLKITKIKFGYKNKNYFMKTKNKEIRVYTHDFLPYIYNSDYEYEIGIFGEDVDFLIKKYANNYNVPEWLAISCFLEIIKKKYVARRCICLFCRLELKMLQI
jgi:hypothetical protein